MVIITHVTNVSKLSDDDDEAVPDNGNPRIKRVESPKDYWTIPLDWLSPLWAFAERVKESEI